MQTISEKTHKKVWTNSAPAASKSNPSQGIGLEKNIPQVLPTAVMTTAMELEEAEEEGEREHTAARFWKEVSKNKYTHITRKSHSSDLVGSRQNAQPAHF